MRRFECSYISDHRQAGSVGLEFAHWRIAIGASSTVSFKAGKALKDVMNWQSCTALDRVSAQRQGVKMEC